jgi:hypothetical protein
MSNVNSVFDLFKPRELNDAGMVRCAEIKDAFADLMYNIGDGAKMGYEENDPVYLALVKTKLEEACFLAVRSVAVLPQYQMPLRPLEPLEVQDE